MKNFVFLAIALGLSSSAFAVSSETFNCGAFAPATPETLVTYSVLRDKSSNGPEQIILRIHNNAVSTPVTTHKMTYIRSVVGDMEYVAEGFKASISGMTGEDVTLTQFATGKIQKCVKQ